MKIGDKVKQLERSKSYPNGEWWWDGEVTFVNEFYTEVRFKRDRDLEWVKELCKSLGPINRSFEMIIVKNYDLSYIQIYHLLQKDARKTHT